MKNFSIKLYCALLKLYPPDFREEYNFLMAQCFRDLCNEADKQGKLNNLIAIWARVLPDYVVSLVKEHVEAIIKNKAIANPGAMVVGPYLITAPIGQGSVSSVYRAFDAQREKEVAIKLVRPKDELAAGFDQLSRDCLQREARVLASLNHPAIPRIYRYEQTPLYDYLAIDYFKGQTLLEIVESSPDFLDEPSLIQWGIQACNVLEYMHTAGPEPILYRDFKASNVVIDEAGEFHLIDFGISVPYSKGTTFEGIGTEGYAAPEQYEGHEDFKSDLYSLGVTLHQLATRMDPRETVKSNPFSFVSPHSVNPVLSEAFNDLIQQAVELDPGNRFQTAVDMRNALNNCL